MWCPALYVVTALLCTLVELDLPKTDSLQQSLLFPCQTHAWYIACAWLSANLELRFQLSEIVINRSHLLLVQVLLDCHMAKQLAGILASAA